MKNQSLFKIKAKVVCQNKHNLLEHKELSLVKSGGDFSIKIKNIRTWNYLVLNIFWYDKRSGSGQFHINSKNAHNTSSFNSGQHWNVSTTTCSWLYFEDFCFKKESFLMQILKLVCQKWTCHYIGPLKVVVTKLFT